MKHLKTIFILLVLTLFILFTSCQNRDKQKEDSTSPTTEEHESSTHDASTDIHTHLFGDWTTVQEATCQKSGTKERICSCGNKESETISPIPHQYENHVCTMCKQRDPDAFTPDYPTGQANVVGSDLASSNYTLQANYLYFSANGNKINKMKTDRTGLQTVYQVSAGKVFNVNVVGDWIYFYCEGSTTGKSYIAKVRTDGSGFEKLVNSVSIGEMLVVKDTVYYTVFPVNGEYKDFAKDVMPLYSISVNGGNPKQLHDGSVGDMVADSTYLYFIHANENGKQTISRIKHGSTSSNVLLTNKEIFTLSIENSKLYFFVLDPTRDISALASISISGGSYTVYGNVMQYTEKMHVVGNKAYYMGGLYSENDFLEEAGLVEYDLTTKRARIVKEDYESFSFEIAKDLLIFENYNYNTEILESFTLYYAKTNTFKEVSFS